MSFLPKNPGKRAKELGGNITGLAIGGTAIGLINKKMIAPDSPLKWLTPAGLLVAGYLGGPYLDGPFWRNFLYGIGSAGGLETASLGVKEVAKAFPNVPMLAEFSENMASLGGAETYDQIDYQHYVGNDPGNEEWEETHQVYEDGTISNLL